VTAAQLQESWAKAHPRPEWDDPAYWESCQGLVPEMDKDE